MSNYTGLYPTGTVSEFNYLGFMLDEKGEDDPDRGRKVLSDREVASEINCLLNACIVVSDRT